MKILTEAGGSLVSSYMIKSIKISGHYAVSSDITSDCAGASLADEFLIFPRANEPKLWDAIEAEVIKNDIDVVVPSFDEMLLGWAERRQYFAKKGINVLVSDASVIETFQDKWKTFEFFQSNLLAAPATSLTPKFPFLKPRFGRGSVGIKLIENREDRIKYFSEGYVSQEFLKGTEYTVDCLFDHASQPVYIIPRKRLNIINGKSLGGVVCLNSDIIKAVRELGRATNFVGPVNVQLFVGDTPERAINFIEVNPRIGGGTALAFAASENWVPLFIDILQSKKIIARNVKDNLKMYRQYEELFVE